MLGTDFVKLVCETLGITSTKVRAVKITADCAGAVMVEVEEYLSAEQAAKIVAALPCPVRMDGEDWQMAFQRREEELAFMQANVLGVLPADLPALPQACSCGGVNGAHNYPCPQWKEV